MAMMPLRGGAQTFLSAWGPETNGLSGRLILSVPKRSENVRFNVQTQITNHTDSAIRYTSMPQLRLSVRDDKGFPAPLASLDGNTMMPEPSILTIPPNAIVTIALSDHGLVTTTVDSVVLEGRLLVPGKWTISARIIRDRAGDEPGGWYGILTIPQFDLLLTKKDLDTGKRMWEEIKAIPEPTSAGDALKAAPEK